MKNRILIFILLFLGFNSFNQAKLESPFTNSLIQLDSTGNYKFIVSGHFHGSGSNRTGFPTNTLLANLDWINNSDANMIICLGDLFLDVRNDIPNYQKSLFNKLELPLFNVVGNHDLSDDVYEDNFGETNFSFELNGDLHLFLDTEMDDGSIKNEQLKMLKNIETKAAHYTNVFIYSHRTIWSSSYKELNNLFQDNTKSVFGNNFETDVKPIIKTISKSANVFWFSGSLGSAPASFFQFKDDNIQYIATAIRGLPRDAVLVVNVINKKVSFKLKSFTGQSLMELNDYNVGYWESNLGVEPFNYRLLPYYIKLTLTHYHFWIGVVTSLFILFVFKQLKKRLFKTK